MSQERGEAAGLGERDTSAFGGKAERYYMNKAYGRSLERARELDEQPHEQQGGGEFHRATIEPDAGGGHKVIVERSTTVIRGGRDGRRAERTEHSFAKPQDTLQFLEDILRGRLPGEGVGGNHGDASDESGFEDAVHERQGSGIENLLGDVLSGAGS